MTHLYDALDRRVKTTYPDGTYEQTIYSRLVSVKVVTLGLAVVLGVRRRLRLILQTSATSRKMCETFPTLLKKTLVTETLDVHRTDERAHPQGPSSVIVRAKARTSRPRTSRWRQTQGRSRQVR